MLVKEYMTPDPFKVSPDESVDRIAELIRVHGIRQVPVVDAANRLVGIVTDRDIRSAIGYGGVNGSLLIAQDVMTTHLVTIEPDADLLEAARLLHEHQFGALPVVDGDRVIGIITTHDLLRRLVELLDEVASHTWQLPQWLPSVSPSWG